MIQRNSDYLKIEWGKIVDFCGLSSLMGEGSELEKNPPSTVSINIRGATSKDINALTEVLTLSFHPSGGWLSFLQPILKLGVSEDLRLRLRGTVPYDCCLVAVEISQTPLVTKEKVIGTVELSLKNGFNCEYLYISNLAVLETHRRKGIAKKLLKECEQMASKWGYDSLNLHVLEDNYAAQKLYLSNGYKICETELLWPNWFWVRSQKFFLKKKL